MRRMEGVLYRNGRYGQRRSDKIVAPPPCLAVGQQHKSRRSRKMWGGGACERPGPYVLPAPQPSAGASGGKRPPGAEGPPEGKLATPIVCAAVFIITVTCKRDFSTYLCRFFLFLVTAVQKLFLVTAVQKLSTCRSGPVTAVAACHGTWTQGVLHVVSFAPAL